MPRPSTAVLLIEDNPLDTRLVREWLRDAGADHVALRHVEHLSAGLAALEAGDVDVVLLDLGLPDSQGLDTFLRLHAAAPQVPVVVLSGLDDQEVALQAVHAGAQDYLAKGQANGELLSRTLRHAVERGHLFAQAQAARAEAEAARRRAELLARASDVFAQSLEYETTLRQAADLVVASLASYLIMERASGERSAGSVANWGWA